MIKELTKEELLKMAKDKDFPNKYSHALSEYFYELRHGKQDIWLFLNIEDVTPKDDDNKEEIKKRW